MKVGELFLGRVPEWQFKNKTQRNHVSIQKINKNIRRVCVKGNWVELNTRELFQTMQGSFETNFGPKI